MMRSSEALKAPFPWFGGKSTIADDVWRRFGTVKNYVEPFFGSGAMLLGRPDWRPGVRLVETVNDADGLLANFWRALQHDPAGVAEAADWPVNECDLHARHMWLVGQREALTDRLMGDPEWYDVRAAGWWVWGQSAAIMGNWCQKTGVGRPCMGPGYGVLSDGGVKRLTDCAERLRGVRVLCGDWARSVTTTALGLHWWEPVAVFLDPPYANALRADGCYVEDCGSVAADVTAWALEHGGNPALRIAVCGYDVEHEALGAAGWRVMPWRSHGGLGDRASENAGRERVWFSPACIPCEGDIDCATGEPVRVGPWQPSLFGEVAHAR